MIKVAGHIGVAVETRDKQSSSNNNGIYSIRLSINGEQAFYQKMDYLQFRKIKYIRSHMEYHYFDCCRKRVHKCYVDPINNLEIYPYHNRSLTMLTTQPNKNYDYRLDVIDIERNPKYRLLSSRRRVERQIRLSERISPRQVLCHLCRPYLRSICKQGRNDHQR